MRYSPQLLDEIRARLPVSQVVARKVALKRKGREYAGLSPFKTEKTPSFFVNDQKGFYHCFASGEHGDIFKFVMQTEGLSFPEAVERLAAEAGVLLPKPTERDQQHEDERTRLYALLESSARFFEDRLKGPEGAEARRYLEKRGLQRQTIASFRLGYAPNSKSALREHLAKSGYSIDEMAKSGMLISGDDIPVAYDRFRHRVMFPITDLKDRVIAFGGRALDKDVSAKYLNSPETPLFHKGSVLFNAARARPLAYQQGRIVAVEGYMDVVALAEAGLGYAVAPLGTALTEDQVRLLWRMVPEPILCFDGDSAGRKAAFRAVDTVLPHLRPGVSVAFAFLPNGLDPDDLIRRQGAAAMQAVLDRPRPLADVLWEREWAGGDWSTPERRARLQSQLAQLTARIADGTVRAFYEREMRERLAKAWSGSQARSGRPQERPARFGRGDPRNARPWGTAPGPGGYRQPGRPGLPIQAPPPTASSSLRHSALVAGQGSALPSREALILRTMLNHPWLIEEEAERIAGLEFSSPLLSRLRDALLSLQAEENSLDRSRLRSQLSQLSLDKVVDSVERAITHKSDRFSEPDAAKPEVEVGWRHTLAMHTQQSGLRRELAAAERLWHQDGSEDALARIYEIQRLLARNEGFETRDDGFG
jgi:DNA primase